MKFSIFLCLLPFTWSNPPDSPSSNNFVFPIPQGQSSLNIWNIAGDKEKPTEVEFIKPESISFDSNQTYIVVNVLVRFGKNKQMCQAFYWVGADTSLPHRQHTATYISTLLRELEEQMNEDYDLITLSREMDGEESIQFGDIFGMNAYIHPCLYKVSGSKGQYVKEIPWIYSELNGSDSFLFYMNDMVLIWNGKSCNKHQEKTTMALAYRIQIYERYRKGISLEIGNLYANESEQFDIFKENFFSYMSDVPLSGDFPKFPEFVPDNNILIKRNIEFEAYEYYSENGIIVASVISERPITLARFKSQHTYLILDHYIGNVFMYIGKHATSDIIASTLSDAEYYHIHMNLVAPDGVWRKVTVLREDRVLPTHFIVNFPEEIATLKLTSDFDETLTLHGGEQK